MKAHGRVFGVVGEVGDDADGHARGQEHRRGHEHRRRRPVVTGPGLALVLLLVETLGREAVRLVATEAEKDAAGAAQDGGAGEGPGHPEQPGHPVVAGLRRAVLDERLAEAGAERRKSGQGEPAQLPISFGNKGVEPLR